MEEQEHETSQFLESYLNSSQYPRTENSEDMENGTSDVMHITHSQSNRSEEVSGTFSITKGLDEEMSTLGISIS